MTGMRDQKWGTVPPDAIAEAKDLKREFDRGDRLAPFECAWFWREQHLPPTTLPDWVTTFFADVAAKYFDESPLKKVSPREFRDIPSKERNRLIPSLDEKAGLRGRGKDGAWLWRVERSRDPLLTAWLDNLVEKAESGEKTHILVKESLSRGRKVKILDSQSQIRNEIREIAAKEFKLGGFPGEQWNRARSVARRTKAVRGEDK